MLIVKWYVRLFSLLYRADTSRSSAHGACTHLVKPLPLQDWLQLWSKTRNLRSLLLKLELWCWQIMWVSFRYSRSGLTGICPPLFQPRPGWGVVGYSPKFWVGVCRMVQTPYFRLEQLKNHTLKCGTYPYSLYVGVAPPPPAPQFDPVQTWQIR